MRYLKHATAVTIKFGPFVDSTDGATAETGLTIQKADVRLSKNGGNMAAANSDQGVADAGAPHDELGFYDVSLDTTDTATVGHLKVMVAESGALPVWDEFTVLPEGIFNGMFAGQLGLEKVVIQSTGNDNAVTITGKGTGAGMVITGGDAGDAGGSGLRLVGGAAAIGSETAGDGLTITGGASAVEDVPSGTAVSIAGGAGSGGSPGCQEAVLIQNNYDGFGLVIEVTGGVDSTGEALRITSDYGNAVWIDGGRENDDAVAGTNIGMGVYVGGSAEGVKIIANCRDNQEGYGLDVWAAGEDGGAAVRLAGHAASGLVPALLLTETDGDGPVVQISPRDGVGVQIDTGNAGNSPGVRITGHGSGAGVELNAGATGNGLSIAGGGTSGNGIKITSVNGDGVNINAEFSGDGVDISATNGDGIKAVGAGSGKYDINADIHGSIDGSVASVTGLTASRLDANVSSRSSHSAADVVTALYATAVEGSTTFVQWIRRMGAVLFGKASGGGSAGSKKFRNTADTVDRITAVTDDNGNRTSVTFDDD